jgi:hypothetical protein
VPRVGLALALVAAACAGCGGSHDHFRLASTRACLDARGFKTATQDNWLFKPTQGSLVVAFGRQYVSLNFGENDREARNIRNAWRRASHWPIDARANVAYVWSRRAKGRVARVLACLRT